MRRVAGFGVLVVAALIAGVVIGRGGRRAEQIGAERMTAMLVQRMPLLGLAELRPVQTSFEDWTYPGSESLRRGSSVSGSVNGAPFEFQSKAEMRTAEGFEAVVAHYSEKLRSILPIEADDDWSLPPRGSGSAGFNGVFVAYTMPEEHRGRPLKVGVVALQAENCNLQLCLSRGEGEGHTSITAIFSRWPAGEDSRP